MSITDKNMWVNKHTAWIVQNTFTPTQKDGVRVCVCVCRTPKKMREKLAELDYSQNQLKSQNNEMRHLLDVADEEMTALRSENAALKKKVKE